MNQQTYIHDTSHHSVCKFCLLLEVNQRIVLILNPCKLKKKDIMNGYDEHIMGERNSISKFHYLSKETNAKNNHGFSWYKK